MMREEGAAVAACPAVVAHIVHYCRVLNLSARCRLLQVDNLVDWMFPQTRSTDLPLRYGESSRRTMPRLLWSEDTSQVEELSYRHE